MRARISGAVMRFVSCEPMLERVTFGRHLYPVFKKHSSSPFDHDPDEREFGMRIDIQEAGIDWVICGAESGPGARPFSMAGARELRDECIKAGVSFFLKQIPNVLRKGKVIAEPKLDGRQWMEIPE